MFAGPAFGVSGLGGDVVADVGKGDTELVPADLGDGEMVGGTAGGEADVGGGGGHGEDDEGGEVSAGLESEVVGDVFLVSFLHTFPKTFLSAKFD